MTRRYTKRESGLVRYEKGEITADQVSVARKRTAIHLHNIHMVDYSLPHLLVDVYMQGCRDMAEAIISKPSAVFGPAQVRDDEQYNTMKE